MKKENSNDLNGILAQAIDAMKEEYGDDFDIDNINLAELQRRTHISRSKLRRLKKNGFKVVPNGNTGKKKENTVISGYTGLIDQCLQNNITNSSVIIRILKRSGYTGSLSSLKRYILSHKYLIPAKRQIVSPQGNRGRRYTTEPGECYQMDWGFLNVMTNDLNCFKCACFVMVCHHCGKSYVEFFPNAKQENLFIGMIHGFQYMGLPHTVLTDNMRSVTTGRDAEGHPIWHPQYEAFMKSIGFQTKLCKVAHPFTKGKVERLVRFVKENFALGRVFGNITDLNFEVLKWCDEQNSSYHKSIDGIPDEIHASNCQKAERRFIMTEEIREYLCPVRKISFDGFVNYEGRRFGVPYAYRKKTCRICRKDFYVYIYDIDFTHVLTMHNVTWSRKDSYCEDQYSLPQPEEHPTAPVTASLIIEETHVPKEGFRKFAFEDMVKWDD